MARINNGSYHKIAKMYDVLDGLSERFYHKQMRARWIAPLRNERVLELGVGTGKNLKYYHSSNDILAIDNSPHMLNEARRKMGKLIIKKKIKLSLQNAFPWGFTENDFTVGIATFVFCTMKDPTNFLNELLNRIINGGKVILFEYRRPEKNPLFSIMKTYNPISKRLYGVDFDRNPTLTYLNTHVSSVKITPIVNDLIEVVEIIK